MHGGRRPYTAYERAFLLARGQPLLMTGRAQRRRSGVMNLEWDGYLAGGIDAGRPWPAPLRGASLRSASKSAFLPICRTREGSAHRPAPHKQKTPLVSGVFCLYGGEGGIRTLGTLVTYTHFPGVRLRPLGHLSVSLVVAILGCSHQALPGQSTTGQRPACALRGPSMGRVLRTRFARANPLPSDWSTARPPLRTY